jgi:DNA-binding CsgD family transcriptional regulator
MAAPFETPIVCPSLIGRERQLDLLSRLVEQVRARRGHTGLIAGEAGIGKSRLLAELKPTAIAQGLAILQGRCFEPDRVLPYAPLLDLLRDWLSGRTAHEVADILAEHDATLARLLPELAAHLPERPSDPVPDSDQEQRRRVQALVQLFTRFAARQPLILIIEDLHWSDEASLEVVLALARHTATLPILLLMTYRSDEIPAELGSLLAALDRERLAIDMPLTRLSLGDVAAMVRAILALSRPAPAGFVEALFAITEGNPFFVEEMLKSLATTNQLAFTNDDWERIPLPTLQLPRSVQIAVQHRLNRLSAEAREILTLAAVAGRRFDFELLQLLTGRDDTALIRLIKELIQAQLVVEESAETFAFRHALTRQAVEADLLARERQALHRTIGAAIEQRRRSSIDLHLTDLAEHFWGASVWDKVLDYARRAGEQAQALNAPRAAIVQFTRAIEAAQHLHQPPPSTLYQKRAHMHDLLGAFDAAHADYLQALDTARACGDQAAAWHSLQALGWLWTGRDYGRAGEYFQQAVALARTMNDPATLAHTLNRMGNWHTHAEQPQTGLQYHQEALGIFETTGDRASQAATLDLLAITSYMDGDMLGGTAYYERAIALFRTLDDKARLSATLAPFATRGASPMHDTMVEPVVDLAACRAAGEEAIALAHQIEWRGSEAQALMYLGLGLGPRGQYARALDALRACLEIAEEIGHRAWIAGGNFTLGTIYLDLLALPLAREHAERALATAQAIDSRFLVCSASSFLAVICIAQGDLARAEAILDAALDQDAPLETLAQRLIWRARAELALARKEWAAALRIVDQLTASAANLTPGYVIARLWYLRAQALIGLGQAGEAEVALKAAQIAASEHGALPLLWRIQAALGTLYRTHGRREPMEQVVAEAHVLVDTLAAQIPDPQLRRTFVAGAEAQLPHLRPPSSLQAARHAHDGLTARERQVAALIAQGLSNRALADTLVVSERTIAKHVENILSKLHFTSRAQIAAWAVEKGLSGDVRTNQ